VIREASDLPNERPVAMVHNQTHHCPETDFRYGWSFADMPSQDGMSASPLIVLQKSKIAAVQIFGENLKRNQVNDSHSLGRATEVAHEFGARR
jgi:hypothetical protein